MYSIARDTPRFARRLRGEKSIILLTLTVPLPPPQQFIARNRRGCNSLRPPPPHHPPHAEDAISLCLLPSSPYPNGIELLLARSPPASSPAILPAPFPH